MDTVLRVMPDERHADVELHGEPLSMSYANGNFL
jgi:hypothetical protein